MTLADDGALTFAATPGSVLWAKAANDHTQAILSDPARLAAQDLRHGRTWMVGLDALPNTPTGAINGVPLTGPWDGYLPKATPLHKAQLSVVFPGYPKQDPNQSAANHRFRIKRCAAHMDGLLPEGPNNRRFAREFHAYILGIALNESTSAPTVYWKGSHQILGAALRDATRTSDLRETDLTEAYQDARNRIFDSCAPTPLPTKTGESFLLHRFTLHGTAPWSTPDTAPRALAFFRPEVTDWTTWLTAP